MKFQVVGQWAQTLSTIHEQEIEFAKSLLLFVTYNELDKTQEPQPQIAIPLFGVDIMMANQYRS